jgi:hypothetical protein
MSFSNYAEGKILDHMLGTTSWTMPSTIYVKLHTGDPSEDGTANAAAETTRKLCAFNAASGGSATNSGAISWTSYPGAETITHVSVWDNVSAGNCLGAGSLSASKTMASGDTLTFNSGQLSVTLD